MGLEALGELMPRARLRPDRGARIPTGILRGWLHLPVAAQEPRAARAS